MAAISIGGASGYWGEAAHATQQLLTLESLDFLVYDYLAEVTLSIMARARARDERLGYAVDFVTGALEPNLARIAKRNVKVVSNAGGMNPQACGAAVRAAVERLGLALKVTVIEGDDLLKEWDREPLSKLSSCTEMFTGDSFPRKKCVVSANAYLGAWPIACALNEGADIVITGRCVDSAVTLGACIASFGWAMDDFDKLAQGSLAGHLIECGPQATGGNFTDWNAIEGELADIGYPVAVIEQDGSFSISKPESTSGLVTPGSVSEQLVYEIHDPQNYTLPDVVCDFSQVKLNILAPDTVGVEGALGFAPPETYKVSVTYTDGYKAAMSLHFIGFEAASKARAFSSASMKRAERELHALGLAAFSDRSSEVIGAGSQFGEGNLDAKEVTLNIAVRHEEKAGAACFIRAVTGMGLATPAGMAVFQSGRPSPSPVIRLFSCAINKRLLDPATDNGLVRKKRPDRLFEAQDRVIQRPEPPVEPGREAMSNVALVDLAFGRSGDKGDRANIGIIARDPDFLPWIWAAITPERVAEVFAHFSPSKVERFLLPGSYAINFVLHDVLGGGGMASIRSDAQGKAYAQVLLHESVPVPSKFAEPI